VPFAIRILGGVETATFVRQVAEHVIKDFARHFFLRRTTRDLKTIEIGAGELRLIVEHFLEVRDVPEFVHRVAVKAPAEMVAQAARRHRAQREKSHRPRRPAVRRARALAG
jgi:hypothetical protein